MAKYFVRYFTQHYDRGSGLFWLEDVRSLGDFDSEQEAEKAFEKFKLKLQQDNESHPDWRLYLEDPVKNVAVLSFKDPSLWKFISGDEPKPD